jgi:hypothetical protein
MMSAIIASREGNRDSRSIVVVNPAGDIGAKDAVFDREIPKVQRLENGIKRHESVSSRRIVRLRAARIDAR